MASEGGAARWRTLPARILAKDPERDLAALQWKGGHHRLPTIQLGDSRTLRAGQWVLALGHPWGVEGAATAGIVIGMGADWPEMPNNGRDWISISLHLRPGHSGGPLVDAQGRLVGINTMINGPDVGVAIPTHVVVEFLKGALLAKGRPGRKTPFGSEPIPKGVLGAHATFDPSQ